jgi:hypothetical protein
LAAKPQPNSKVEYKKDLIFSCARGLTHFRYHSKSSKLYAFYILANLRLDLIMANIQADFLKRETLEPGDTTSSLPIVSNELLIPFR